MDDEWRRAERAWRAAPDDPQAVGTAVAAAQRARAVVPWDLLRRRRLPARTYTAAGRDQVLVETLGGARVIAGDTYGGRVVQVPECRAWWVHPTPEVRPRPLADELAE